MDHYLTGTAKLILPLATLSSDGYVRLTLDALLAIPLVHLISGVDEDNQISAVEGASPASISGYTEWVSTTIPALTVGWDWQLGVSNGLPSYTRLDSVRANIMLVDAQRCDFGSDKTNVMLESAIDAIDWQETTDRYISMRYA